MQQHGSISQYNAGQKKAKKKKWKYFMNQKLIYGDLMQNSDHLCRDKWLEERGVWRVGDVLYLSPEDGRTDVFIL